MPGPLTLDLPDEHRVRLAPGRVLPRSWPPERVVASMINDTVKCDLVVVLVRSEGEAGLREALCFEACHRGHVITRSQSGQELLGHGRQIVLLSNRRSRCTLLPSVADHARGQRRYVHAQERRRSLEGSSARRVAHPRERRSGADGPPARAAEED